MPSSGNATILVIEDTAPLARVYESYLREKGYIRQLENTICSIVKENEGATVMERMSPKDLKNFGRNGKAPGNHAGTADLVLVDYKQSNVITPLWVMEMETIVQALEYTRHDITKAAALLEVSPSTLYRKIRGWQNSEDLISKSAVMT